MGVIRTATTGRLSRRCLLSGALLALLALGPGADGAQAQSYPAKTVRIVVAAPPGGLTDVVARAVAQFLQERLGQPFVIENMPGASATLGAAHVARSAPDGYTLLVNPSLFVITPMLMKVPYDVTRDFTPISNLGNVPLAIGINPAIPARTLPEFIALAKADPDKYSWGSEGTGSVGHLTMEWLQREAGFKLLVVTYKGTSPTLIDLLGGRISAMISPVPNLIEQFRAGKVRPLAVTSKERVPVLPDVPTLREAGLPEFEIGSWYGMWGPANVPRQAVSVLNAGIAEAMKSPRVVERVAAQGLIPLGSDAASFSAFMAAEIAKFSQLISEANIRPAN